MSKHKAGGPIKPHGAPPTPPQALFTDPFPPTMFTPSQETIRAIVDRAAVPVAPKWHRTTRMLAGVAAGLVLVTGIALGGRSLRRLSDSAPLATPPPSASTVTTPQATPPKTAVPATPTPMPSSPAEVSTAAATATPGRTANPSAGLFPNTPLPALVPQTTPLFPPQPTPTTGRELLVVEGYRGNAGASTPQGSTGGTAPTRPDEPDRPDVGGSSPLPSGLPDIVYGDNGLYEKADAAIFGNLSGNVVTITQTYKALATTRMARLLHRGPTSPIWSGSADSLQVGQQIELGIEGEGEVFLLLKREGSGFALPAKDGLFIKMHNQNGWDTYAPDPMDDSMIASLEASSAMALEGEIDAYGHFTPQAGTQLKLPDSPAAGTHSDGGSCIHEHVLWCRGWSYTEIVSEGINLFTRRAGKAVVLFQEVSLNNDNYSLTSTVNVQEDHAVFVLDEETNSWVAVPASELGNIVPPAVPSPPIISSATNAAPPPDTQTAPEASSTNALPVDSSPTNAKATP